MKKQIKGRIKNNGDSAKSAWYPLVIILQVTVLLGSSANAQLYVQGEVLKIAPNATLTVQADLITAKDGVLKPKIRNWGTISVQGDVNLDADTDYKGQGDLEMSGSTVQTISPNVPLKKIDIKNGNDVALSGHLNLQGQITLSNGNLLLGDYNLTMDDSASISGGSSSSYIRINGTGNLVSQVGSSPVTFPIGRNPYLPVIIDNGGDAEYTIGVSQNVYDNPETNSGLKTTNVVGETWTIQSSTAETGVTVTLQWDQNEEETGFSRTACMVGYWENGVSNKWDATGSHSGATGSGPYTQSRTLDFSTNLYYFGVGSQGSALPVELTYFTAQWIQNSGLSGAEAQLSWQTAQEINNSHFEVQRSYDGETWEQIGRVEGQGTNNSVHSYQLSDHSLLSSMNHDPSTIFYRLKQIDHNGAFDYSPTRTLRLVERSRDQDQTLRIYPNPAQNQVFISTESPVQEVKIYNLHGQLMISTHQQLIDISALRAGQYIIEVQNGTQVIREKLVKL